MRRDFVKQILVEMDADPNIVFLTADLGFNALEEVERRFPERFYNVGIAEQHMVGMAAGLALEGKKVITYSIASFATMRPYEQIRTDICYHDLDVKIIGTGGGYNYPNHGVTHHTVEDLAIMSVLPHMVVLNPGHSWEAREATRAIIAHKGPAYLRLGRSPGVAYEQKGHKFKIGKGYVVREGKDIVLFSTGNVLDVAIASAERLALAGYRSVAVISMPTVRPLDQALVMQYATNAKGVFTIEEHSTVGGLGSQVAMVLREVGRRGQVFHMFGFPPDRFVKDVGDRDYLLRKVGIEPGAISKKIGQMLAR